MSLNRLNLDGTGNQSGFYNKYPYTDFHELNADFLLTSYQQIIDEINQIVDWANNHQIEYEDAIARLTAVEGEIEGFENEVRNAFAELEAQIAADFEQQKEELQAALAATEAEIDAKMQQLTTEVNAAIASFEQQFRVLKNQILLEVDRLKEEVRQEITEFYNIMQANNEYVFKYVENRLDEFINSLPDITTVYVYNPYRGRVTDLQTAINDLYTIACIWGLTAYQYDSLQLTASEYDALGLTASEYDTLGYKLLFKDPDLYMLSPFTGEYVPVKQVVQDLAQLHIDEGALTATEYDALELDADTYDGDDLTAFQYDWFGKEILAA